MHTLSRSFIFWSLLIFSASIYGQGCGNPPEHATLTSSYKKAWKDMACSSSKVGGNATIPVGDNDPAKLGFTKSDQDCKDASNNEEAASQTIYQYLSTDKTLMVAECGYRLCLLGQNSAATGSAEISARFLEICGGMTDTKSLVGLRNPVSTIEVTPTMSGTTQTVSVWIRGPSEGNLKLRCRADTNDVTCLKGNPSETVTATPSNRDTEYRLSVRFPDAATMKLGDVTYARYTISLGEQATIRKLPGLIKFVKPPEVLNCTQWRANQCMRCVRTAIGDFPVSYWSEQIALSCGKMKPGPASLSVNATVYPQPQPKSGGDNGWWMFMGYRVSSSKEREEWSSCNPNYLYKNIQGFQDPTKTSYPFNVNGAVIQIPDSGLASVSICVGQSQVWPNLPATAVFRDLRLEIDAR
jgi:hypothetical protein